MGSRHIICLKHMSLRLVGFGGENEVLWNHWVFVEEKQVTWIFARNFSN